MQRSHYIKYLFYLLPLLLLILIFLFPTQTRNGAENGLLLWFNVLLPALLPFMILSDLIRRLRIIDILCERISYKTGKNLYFLYPLLFGFLSGLPLGAKLTADAVRNGHLNQKQGQFLLTVCNNSSIIFLMAYVADSQLQRPESGPFFLLFIPLASLLSALIMSITNPLKNGSPAPDKTAHQASQISAASCSAPVPSDSFIRSVSSSIMDSFTVLTMVGGYVILFSILAEFLLQIESLAILPLVASLEMTTGIRAVCVSALPSAAKLILSAAAASFTGFSGIAQTLDVFSGSGLSASTYLISRLLSAFITVLLFSIFMT